MFVLKNKSNAKQYETEKGGKNELEIKRDSVYSQLPTGLYDETNVIWATEFATTK